MSARLSVSTPQRPSVSLQHPRIRPLASPSSPHTPIGRPLSLYGGPQSPFRVDDEALIITLGCRTLYIGFAGESSPRAVLRFGADTRKRVGDWSSRGTEKRKRWQGKEEDEWKWWGNEDELWRMDCRECDFTLMEAKLQRALRTAMVDHVLAEAKSRKIYLGAPSELPDPIFERVVASLFAAVQAVPSITVLPHAVLTVVGSGMRVGLVVDIGWNETIVTAVVELREVLVRRSVRAGKMLSFAMSKVLDEHLQHARQKAESRSTGGVVFEDAEEVLTRVGWCKVTGQQEQDMPFTIPALPSTGLPIQLPFSALAEPAEESLFSPASYDEHDLPLPLLVFNVLLNLPIDSRRVCMSRIVMTGGVSRLPGVKTRLLQDLEQLISSRGWEKVKDFGSAKDKVARISKPRQRMPHSVEDTNIPTIKEDPDEPVPPSARLPESDPITRKLQQMNIVDEKETEGGFVRAVDTVGAWAGASLLANLRIKGPEIEREKFSTLGLGCLGGDYSGWNAKIMKDDMPV